ncbi:MAG: KOW domain-containing RNA-binding protein [Oscillospiraceae bacterium]|nr:KOW domain-containing RNA-binding protein [Oscillospiraceae bacterium]
MRVDIADIVIPLNGRDAGARFLVIGSEEEYSLLADGKGRRVEKPKRKKNKHVVLEDKAVDWIAERLRSGDKVSNSEVRRALAEYTLARQSEGGM